jgi:hypothetical protein
MNVAIDARTVHQPGPYRSACHRRGILAVIRARVDNDRRLEGANNRIRLISNRSFGSHSAAPLIAFVYLLLAHRDLPSTMSRTLNQPEARKARKRVRTLRRTGAAGNTIRVSP